jgi:hypothetical protein
MANVTIAGIYTLNSVNVNSTFGDTTDYAGQGLTPGDYEGRIKAELTTSSGQFAYYDNLSADAPPDITPGVVNVKAIPLPNDPLTNYPVKGIYTITYQLTNVQTQENQYYTIVFTFDFTVPVICIQTEVNCNSSLIRTTDITKYTTYLVGDPDRTHILFPPPASSLPSKSVTTPINIYNNIVTTTWTCKITSICTWLVLTSNGVDNVFFIASITGNKEIAVDCNTNLCSMVCCMQEMIAKYNQLFCSNTIEAARYKTLRVDPSMSLITQILAMQTCGKPDEVAILIEALKITSGCTGDCGCDDNTPQVVLPQTGSGSGGSVVVDSPNGTISVVAEVNGDTTTYHLEVSNSILTTINNLHNVTLSSTDNSITITPTIGVDGTVNYNIITASSNVTPAIEVWMRVEDNSGWTVTPTFINRVGTNVSPEATFKFILGDLNPNAATTADAVFIAVKDFFVQPQIFTCASNVMKYDFVVNRASVATIARTVMPFEAHILYAEMDVPDTNLWVQLKFMDGTPVLISDLEEYGNKVDIRLTIKPQVS